MALIIVLIVDPLSFFVSMLKHTIVTLNLFFTWDQKVFIKKIKETLYYFYLLLT